VRRCRHEQTSVAGVIVAAVCCGLKDCLPADNPVFKVQIPFDLRDELLGPDGAPTGDDLGSFVSLMNEYYELRGESDFWNVARQAHENVQEFVRRGGPSFYYNLLTMISERLVARPVFASMRSHARVTLLATNYGVLNIRDAYGTLRPRACTLVLKNDAIGPSLVIEALVMGHRLNLGLAADGLVPEFWTRLAAAVRGHVDAAACPGGYGVGDKAVKPADSSQRRSAAPRSYDADEEAAGRS